MGCDGWEMGGVSESGRGEVKMGGVSESGRGEVKIGGLKVESGM